MKAGVWAVFAVCFGGLISESAGCSTVRVDTPDGPVIARTLEIGGDRSPTDPDFHGRNFVISHPKGEAGGGALSSCNNTLGWTAKYTHLNLGWGESMNVMGLTVSAQTFRESLYQNEGGDASKPALCWTDLAQWIVANHASVSEVVAALDTVSVIYQGSKTDSGLRVHWTVEDKTGGVVVEYMKGKAVVHNNTVGVLTNDPPFDWHLRNLNNYVNLRPDMPQVSPGMQVNTELGTVPRVIGHGSNLNGIPGGSTPADRFVRLWYLRSIAETNVPPRNISEGVGLAAAVISSVYLPKGAVAAGKGDYYSWEFTQWTVIKVPSRSEFYFRGYMEDRWRVIHLDRMPPVSRSFNVFQGGIVEAAEDVTDLGGKEHMAPRE